MRFWQPSTAEEEELARRIARWREEDAEAALAAVARAAIRYRRAARRSEARDPAAIRMARGRLAAAVERAHAALNPGPLRPADIEHARLMRDWIEVMTGR